MAETYPQSPELDTDIVLDLFSATNTFIEAHQRLKRSAQTRAWALPEDGLPPLEVAGYPIEAVCSQMTIRKIQRPKGTPWYLYMDLVLNSSFLDFGEFKEVRVLHYLVDLDHTDPRAACIETTARFDQEGEYIEGANIGHGVVIRPSVNPHNYEAILTRPYLSRPITACEIGELKLAVVSATESILSIAEN